MILQTLQKWCGQNKLYKSMYFIQQTIIKKKEGFMHEGSKTSSYVYSIKGWQVLKNINTKMKMKICCTKFRKKVREYHQVIIM